MNDHLPPLLRNILNRFATILTPEGMQERDEKLRDDARRECIDEQRERAARQQGEP